VTSSILFTPKPAAMKPSQAAPIEIDIWSDVVCPFCYIDRTDYLMDVAVQAGLDQAVIREALGDAALEKEIDADSMTAQRLGIQGVPFFVVNQKYAVSGAQPISIFMQVLEKVRDEMKPVTVAGTDGDVCGPDGVC